jgi:hypothetical protein
MEQPKIEIIRNGEIRLTYDSLPDFELNLNFNPIIEKLRLNSLNFCLLHWQAKPFCLRRYGVYDGKRYVSTLGRNLNIRAFPVPIEIEEKSIKTIPTAILFFPQTKLEIQKGCWHILPI